ncbi:MAG: hypothetical protein ACO26G_02600, partial [Rickettsiales bacterium]
MRAPSIEKKIQVSQFYDEGSAPDFDQSDHIIFVLSGENNTPKKFMELFKEHYKNKYDGKKLVFLHTRGGHWTTYECDYNYDPNSEPVITRHEIRGDGRCGLHAVAKALQIVSGRQNLVENIRFLGNEYSQFPDSAQKDIFSHLGLDVSKLKDKWIDRIEKKSDEETKIEREGYSLGTRIQSLTDTSSQNDWLSSDDIEYILLYTNIQSKNNSKICLGSSNEQINMLPASSKEIGGLSSYDTDKLDQEILRKIFDDKNWNDDNKFVKSKTSYSEVVKNYLDIHLFRSGDRFEALKNQLIKYEELNYEKMGDKIKVSQMDKFNNIPFFYEKEGFLRFITNNHASFDQKLKGLIKKTLMYMKIRNMHEGDPEKGLFDLEYITKQKDEDGKIVKKPSTDKFARIKINDLIEEFLELYPEGQDTTTIDDNKKRKLLESIGEAFSNAPETIPKTIIKIDRSSVQEHETKADGGTISRFNIKKFNSIDFGGYDIKKLKELKYIKMTEADDQVKVQKVSVDNDKIILQELASDQEKYGEICCYSEYVKYAEKDKSSSRPEAKDFFSFEPKKYKGFGLKIRFEEKNQELFFDECFNGIIKKEFEGKEGKKILKINGESIKKHLATAEKLGIKPEYYINSLFRAEDSDIKLTFDNGDVNLIKDSKMTFEKKDNGSYLVSHDNIDIEQRKTEIDKLMILGKKVTFEAQRVKSAQSLVKGSNVRFRADDVQASSASPENATRAIKGIKDASKFQDLISSNVHFDWWFVNDFNNGSATGGPCKYSAEDKKSLLGNKEYLNNSLDLANEYFDQLLASESGTTIYGIRLIKIYNYLTILKNYHWNNHL